MSPLVVMTRLPTKRRLPAERLGVVRPAQPPRLTIGPRGRPCLSNALLATVADPGVAPLLTSPRQITVRNPSAELVEALRAVAHERGESLNATILHLLGVALGVDERRRRLKRCASWTVEDLEEFEGSLRAQRVVDPNLWG